MDTKPNAMTNVASYLLSHALDWTRVDIRIAAFSNQDAAREAILCVRDDGMDLAEVARQAGGQVTSSRPMLRELEGVLRSRLLGAAKGAVVGPIVQGKQWLIIQVCDKKAPCAEDAELTTLVKQHLARMIEMPAYGQAA